MEIYNDIAKQRDVTPEKIANANLFWLGYYRSVTQIRLSFEDPQLYYSSADF